MKNERKFSLDVAAPAGGRKTRQTRSLQIFTSARSARSKNLGFRGVAEKPGCISNCNFYYILVNFRELFRILAHFRGFRAFRGFGWFASCVAVSNTCTTCYSSNWCGGVSPCSIVHKHTQGYQQVRAEVRIGHLTPSLRGTHLGRMPCRVGDVSWVGKRD